MAARINKAKTATELCRSGWQKLGPKVRSISCEIDSPGELGPIVDKEYLNSASRIGISVQKADLGYVLYASCLRTNKEAHTTCSSMLPRA